jgi:hypothetical protein
MLHSVARARAEALAEPDRKQLRFNEIVDCAVRFYSADPLSGVLELVDSCDKAQPELYVAKSPMWKTLRDQYAWMEQKNKQQRSA